MSLTRPRSPVTLTRKIIELLRKPPHFTGLDRYLSQLASLLDQLDDANIVIDIGTVREPLATTILIEAARSMHLSVLELVLAKLRTKPNFDFNFSVPTPTGHTATPLIASLVLQHNFQLLLEAGADVRFVSPKSLSALAFAIEQGDFELADVIVKHMLQTHKVIPGATQKDIAIFADALAHVIGIRNKSPENTAKYHALLDRIMLIIKSPQSGYPSDAIEQLLNYHLTGYVLAETNVTLFSQALLFADAKAISVFRPFVSKSSLSDSASSCAVVSAIHSNSPIAYLTLLQMGFDLATDVCIFHAISSDSDKFLEFALLLIARQEKCDSVKDLLARQGEASINGKSLLRAAVDSRAIKVVKFLFANGVSANEFDEDQTPIFWRAIRNVGPDLLNPSIEDGITKEVKIDHLDVATVDGQVLFISKNNKLAMDVVELFLAQQVDVGYIDPISQNDCFMVAAQSQNYYLSHLLMTRCHDRLNLDRKNSNQQTLAQVAATCLNIGLMRLVANLRRNNRPMLPLNQLDIEGEAYREYPDCMLSYLVCVDEKWLLDQAMQKMLYPKNVKEEQLIDGRFELLDFCENVIAATSQQNISQLTTSPFSNIFMFIKDLHKLLAYEIGGVLLGRRNAVTSQHLERFTHQATSTMAEHELLLNECLDNACELIISSMPRRGDDEYDPLATLSSVTLASHLRLTQYYLLLLTERLFEWLDYQNNHHMNSSLYASSLKIIEQLSVVIGTIFDSLKLTDGSRYLFSDMTLLGINVREQLNSLNNYKEDIALQNKEKSKLVLSRAAANPKKHRQASVLTEVEKREIEANISKMQATVQHVESTSSTNQLNRSSEHVDNQTSVTSSDTKKDSATAKRKAKNAKKKTRSKNRHTDSVIPEESAIEPAETVKPTEPVISQEESNVTTLAISKSLSLAEKIDQLEARILRRQQMWEASEARKLFDKQRERIEATLTILRLIKRDEQPQSVAEFEMKVRAEFKTVYQVMKPTHDFYFVGGSVINFRKNIKFDSDKYDVDIVGKVTNKSILDKFRLSLFVGDERSNLYMYKSDQIDLDLLCYKPDAELDLKNDVSRRDYTICCVYMNMKGYVDPTGYGLSDIDNNILRMNGDPEQLTSDPVRLLRGLKYILRGFNPEPKLHSVLMSLDDSLFQNLDKQKLIMLQIKSREFFKSHQVDWRNVLAHYQQQHRPKPISTLQAHGTLFYTASQGSVSSNQLAPEHARPSHSN